MTGFKAVISFTRNYKNSTKRKLSSCKFFLIILKMFRFLSKMGDSDATDTPLAQLASQYINVLKELENEAQ